MNTETTSVDPLKVKITSVSHPDGSVSHHVVVAIDDAKIIFDGADKHDVIEHAVRFLRTIADEGVTRLRILA